MHCNPLRFIENESDFPIFYHFQLFSLEFLFRLCVPLFFIISGYLFFVHTETFEFQTYVDKLKRRVHTLLLPYLVWNTLYLLLYFIGCKLMGPMPTEKPVTNFQFIDFLASYWNMGYVYDNAAIGNGLVIDGPLWFIRDLIVMNLLSPLLFLLIKKSKGFIIILFALIWLTEGCTELFAPSDQALFFYSLGASIALLKLRPIYSVDPRILLVIYILLCILLYTTDLREVRPLKHLNDLLGIFTLFQLAVPHEQSTSSNRFNWLADYTFFLYAFFQLPLVLSQKITAPLLSTWGESGLFLCFLLCASATIVVGLLLGSLTKHLLPTTIHNLLIGKRNFAK